MRELRWKRSQKRMVVASFVAGGSSCIAWYHIKSVQESPFAWPLSTLNMIHGETTMGWSAFVAEMRDGTLHPYGTSFSTEFFELPSGYSAKDIVNIHSGMTYAASTGLQKFSRDSLEANPPLREKPYFTCYLNGLD